MTMSCESLETLIFVYKMQRGEQAVTRHRRDCGTVSRSLSAPYSGGSVMNESQFLEYRKRYGRRPFTQEPRDHRCMERWKLHLALADGVVL